MGKIKKKVVCARHGDTLKYVKNEMFGRNVQCPYCDRERNESHKEPDLWVYEIWDGNPKGVPENPDTCIRIVYMNNDKIGHQCRSPRGHGKHGLYCARHGKVEDIYPDESSNA